jgi:hypothetical protein
LKIAGLVGIRVSAAYQLALTPNLQHILSCSSSSRHSALCPDSGVSAGRTIIFVRLVDQRLGTLLGRADHRTSSLVIFYETACAIEHSTNGIVTKGEIPAHGVVHEVGHLLLVSDAHSRVGIMKESYSHEDILMMGQGRLLFSTEESLLLRQAMLFTGLVFQFPAQVEPGISLSSRKTFWRSR